VPIGGWRLQYRSATGATYSSTFATIPSGKAIQSHGYYLVVSGGDAGYLGGAGADQVCTTGAGAPTPMGLAAAGGHVRLGLPGLGSALNLPDGGRDPLVADVLGWGTAAGPEGSPAPVANWANNNMGSLERKANASSTVSTMESGADVTRGNNHDSNDNSADFVQRNNRDPQNSASATEP